MLNYNNEIWGAAYIFSFLKRVGGWQDVIYWKLCFPYRQWLIERVFRSKRSYHKTFQQPDCLGCLNLVLVQTEEQYLFILTTPTRNLLFKCCCLCSFCSELVGLIKHFVGRRIYLFRVISLMQRGSDTFWRILFRSGNHTWWNEAAVSGKKCWFFFLAKEGINWGREAMISLLPPLENMRPVVYVHGSGNALVVSLLVLVRLFFNFPFQACLSFCFILPPVCYDSGVGR